MPPADSSNDQSVQSQLSVLSRYICSAMSRPLPDTVAHAASSHLLDTLASMVSGSRLPPGIAGIRYAEQHGGGAGGVVVGSRTTAGAEMAALANGMSAHADETDDSHEPSLTHPGCAVVPAALALAQRESQSGEALLRAIVLGYDVTTRTSRAAWPTPEARYRQVHSTTAIGGTFGAAAAAAALAGVSGPVIEATLGYASQLASGLKTWLRDRDHIEKAFVFGGLPASAGVRALSFAEAGWSAVDPFEGVPNFLDAFADDGRPQELTAGLGSEYAVEQTNIKQFCVGSPIQAPLQGLFEIRASLAVGVEVEHIEILLPQHLAGVVFNARMPNISLPYLVSVAVEDGMLSYEAAHDESRFQTWAAATDVRVDVGIGTNLPMRREAVVRVRDSTGRLQERHVAAVRGTPELPMAYDDVAEKARELCIPVLGYGRTEALISICKDMARIRDCNQLRKVLTRA